jgi:hypothetical protein
MGNLTTRESALQLIRTNIARYGYHVYEVTGGDPLPRYLYTIGLLGSRGAELILAGAALFSAAEASSIIHQVAREFHSNKTSYRIDMLGNFTLRNADISWSSELMLGALDFYGTKSLRAWQIIPDSSHWTVDIPNLERPWSASGDPVWQWLHLPWTFPVAGGSTAVTNLAALRGERITEAARWEDKQWELFAGHGPDVLENEMRIVALGTLLGTDESLTRVTSLSVGEALWRDSEDGAWQVWRKLQ